MPVLMKTLVLRKNETLGKLFSLSLSLSLTPRMKSSISLRTQTYAIK
jgi:hypothetical protein